VESWRVIVGSIKCKPGLRVESILGQIDFQSGTNTGWREYQLIMRDKTSIII
jgi:hypothetical protein